MKLFSIFKTKAKRKIPYSDFIKTVNSFDFKDFTDVQLREIVDSTKGAKLSVNDNAKIFAVVKETIFRLKAIRLFDTQISAAYSMLNSKIAELLTGEGKTFAAVVAAVAFFANGKSVDILVFNDYLARRDYNDNKEIFDFLGIKSSYIEESTEKKERKLAYSADILYISAKEAGFDYLRDFLSLNKEDCVWQEHDVAIVDEADSILIDEAKIPLVLAGDIPLAKDNYSQIDAAVKNLEEGDYSVQEAENKVWLTDKGISKLETALSLDNLYSQQNTEVLAAVNASLKAYFLLRKDKDYIVKKNNILIVDEATGRVAQNRRFPDDLHAALEMKEKIDLRSQTMIYNSITMQAFLMKYKVLCGMTGTIVSSKEEVFNMYSLEIDAIPPFKPCIRVDHDDVVFVSEAEKQAAVIDEIVGANKKGQPVLLGTSSVEESEVYSNLLKKIGLKHSVLNAKNDEKEAQIIAEAGKPYTITVSTNMAGRGVDIKLGGPDESEKSFVSEVGGLYVISTGINSSLRIDNQLRGRSGRRGDPGESKFFISLTDPLVRAYFEENDIEQENAEVQFKNDAKKSVSSLIRKAQNLEEGRNAEVRYMLEKYTFILEEQRKVITKYRSEVLNYQTNFDKLKTLDYEKYKNVSEKYGTEAIKKAEQQLTLYFINLYWANYLASMEDIRNSIHLMVVGGKSPIFEYNKLAIEAYDDMMNDIKESVSEYLQSCEITKDGIDMKTEGLSGASTTWTYIMDDSSSQFSRIPQLIKTIRKAINNPNRTTKRLFSRLDSSSQAKGSNKTKSE